VLDKSLLDAIVKVSNDESLEMARRLARGGSVDLIGTPRWRRRCATRGRARAWG
jgi:hypothetical protein